MKKKIGVAAILDEYTIIINAGKLKLIKGIHFPFFLIAV